MQPAAPAVRVRTTIGALLSTGRGVPSTWPAAPAAQQRRARPRRESCFAHPSRRAVSGQVNGIMTIRALIAKIFHQEDLNFLLTNRIPRGLATRFMGWFSQIEQPLVRDLSIGLWRLFSDLDL